MNLGVIGCGHIWRTVYYPILDRLTKTVHVVSLCDINSNLVAAASQCFPDARTYSSASELLGEEKLDGVLILTSEVSNARLSRMALEANVPVFLEKPPAVSREELADLVVVKKNASAPLFVAFNRRFTPLLGEWSRPDEVRKVRGVISRHDRDPESFPYAVIHMVDTAQYLCGRPIEDASLRRVSSRESAGWMVSGTMRGGVEFEFLCLYKDSEHRETLVFETAAGLSEICFPNPEAERNPLGRITYVKGRKTVTVDGFVPDPIEAMGYAPCFRSFLRTLLGQKLPLPLEEFEPTVTVLERLLHDARVVGELLPSGPDFQTASPGK